MTTLDSGIGKSAKCVCKKDQCKLHGKINTFNRTKKDVLNKFECLENKELVMSI